MIPGILGKKLGMTQVFDEDGNKIPVTVIEAGPCVVQRIKTKDKDGYSAVQIGYGNTRESLLKKPQREYAKKNGIPAKKFVREIRCDEVSEIKVGDTITTGQFQEGDYLDISGITKGKGFQGGMKRCGWSGGKETHGSMSHRAPGSVGCSASPSRIFKGHGMPGQMGNTRATVQNVLVVEVDKDSSTIAVKGAVPGANGGHLEIRFAKKRPIAERIVPEEAEEQETNDNKEEAEE
ncbi:MAG: 50S ribosomal protein L3 [Candidatus Omnitrophica bacterium]|nr:50S ribosomal protein L3 [Candidatus Omnitrophota bacterium]